MIIFETEKEYFNEMRDWIFIIYIKYKTKIYIERIVLMNNKSLIHNSFS